MGKTLYDKLWNSHVVHSHRDGTALLYIDRHLLHEVTSPQAFEGLRIAGRKPWRVDANFAVCDHNVPTTDRQNGISDPIAKLQVDTLDKNCHEFGITEFDMDDPRQGIIHVVSPEQGLILPGMTVVCGDSHTATHGAFGSLAFGIGTSEVEHVLATQCLLQKKLKNMLVRVDGRRPTGVTAKDIILALIGKITTSGGTGFAIEFSGATIRSLSMESRMTICNMAIEAGARVGLIEVDETTIDYLKNTPNAQNGQLWGKAVETWKSLKTDADAEFDEVITFDVTNLSPQVTWGTSPEMVTSIDGFVPDPREEVNREKSRSMQRALDYMGLKPGTPIMNIYPDKIFIGSCTNARIEDLRAAAKIVKGHRIAENIRLAMVVPGTGLVKKQAEKEGLDVLFKKAGFEWREPGCSLCLAMNEDRLEPGERCASTSNRNFEGRQGPGGRTHLVSPTMAAAAAIAGYFVDVRKFNRNNG